MRRKAQVLLTLLVFFLTAGVAVGHKVVENRNKLLVTPTNYLDGSESTGTCESCTQNTSQSSQKCDVANTGVPCTCQATSGNQSGSTVNARILNSSSECQVLFQQPDNQ